MRLRRTWLRGPGAGRRPAPSAPPLDQSRRRRAQSPRPSPTPRGCPAAGERLRCHAAACFGCRKDVRQQRCAAALPSDGCRVGPAGALECGALQAARGNEPLGRCIAMPVWTSKLSRMLTSRVPPPRSTTRMVSASCGRPRPYAIAAATGSVACGATHLSSHMLIAKMHRACQLLCKPRPCSQSMGALGGATTRCACVGALITHPAAGAPPAGRPAAPPGA